MYLRGIEWQGIGYKTVSRMEKECRSATQTVIGPAEAAQPKGLGLHARVSSAPQKRIWAGNGLG